MKRDKQIIWLGVAMAVLLGMASYTQAAYTKCKVLDGSDFEGGTLIIQCDPEKIKDIKVGDTIKSKKVVKKAYEGC